MYQIPITNLLYLLSSSSITPNFLTQKVIKLKLFWIYKIQLYNQVKKLKLLGIQKTQCTGCITYMSLYPSIL